MKNKNILAMVLAASMALPTNIYALSKSDFSDFPNDWSTPALTSAIENGLLVGTNGKINSSDFITRAEISAIINRAFKATKTSSLSNYKDVPSSAWYYNDMAKAVHMGTFVGSNGFLYPEKNITREEAFSAIARAFLIDEGDYSELSKFNDGNTVSDWAKKSISGLIKKGYIKGSNGNINPKSYITRAEFAQIMYMIVGSYISSSGEYSNNINGNLVVSSDNVTLKNATIDGDLIVADGVDTGKLILDNVSVKGKILVRGGNNINITGSTSTGDIIVQNNKSNTEINIDKNSSVGNISHKTEIKVTGEGKKGSIKNLTDNSKEEKTLNIDKPSKSSSGSSNSRGNSSSTTNTTYNVSNWQELKSAAYNAKSGDTIKLKENINDAGTDTAILDGVSSATLIISKKNITFDGNNKTITAKEGKTFCFDIDGLEGTTTGIVVKNLTIDGASFSTKLGGAFFVEDGAETTFENVTFKNCKANNKSDVTGGGAIFINDHGKIPPKVTVKNCTFENNSIPSKDGSFTGRGGAIYANNFRAQTPMNVNIINSTFKNNNAAYGGAIAVDGIVNIKITGCTFENNNGIIGADDIYIYEGISSGKKKLSITSKVNANLSNNTYTNKSDSKNNMQEMNIIFSRYYPSDFTGDMTRKAPEGTKDLTFKDIERKEIIENSSIKIENNKLVITGDSGISIDKYRNAITEVYINGTSIKGVKGTSIINEDGSINFDAKSSDNGSTNPIFSNGADSSYALKLVANGYPTVSGTVGNSKKPITPELTGTLTDGEWYGIGDWSLYYENKGPDIVRIIVKNGAIQNAYGIKYTEDSGFERGKNILYNIAGLKDITSIKEQLENKKGTAYDSVSGATMTAKGHLSAVENAIKRSIKFTNDKKEQKIMWMDFSNMPKSTMNFGKKLDLTDVKLNIYLSPNGEKKEIGFDQLDDYGITTSIQNGTVITENTPELSPHNSLQIYFKQQDSLISIPSKVVVSKKTNYTIPSHIIANLENGETKRIDINEKSYEYTLSAIGNITSMEIYAGDKKLTDGKYSEEYNDWEFSLKGIKPAESDNTWKYQTYRIIVDNSQDTSKVKSFELDTNYLTTTYGVGYKLNLNDLRINIITEKGSKQKLENWQACLDRGFTATPENEYTFKKDDATNNVKEIKISYGDLSEKFTVNVIDYEKQIPAKVEIYDGNSIIKTINVTMDDWKNSNGMLTIYDVDMPEKYIDWSENTFTLKVFNSSNEVISKEDYTIEKQINGKALEIALNKYTEYDSYGGYLRLYFKFSDTEPVAPKSNSITKTSKPISVGYGYDVTATVTAENGKIANISWSNTDSGTNSNWTNIFENGKETFFNKFIGLTKENAISTIDSLKINPSGDKVDAVSGATYTSKAVRDAIKNAYEQILSESGEVVAPSAPIISSSDFRTKLMYSANGKAELSVSSDEDCEIIYTTDGTEPSKSNGTTTKEKTISINSPSTSDNTVILKAIAGKNNVYSDISTTEIKFFELPKLSAGTKVYEATETCPGKVGKPYEVKIKVTTLDGKIQKVEDMGTTPSDIRDKVYWKYLFPRTSGKSITSMLEGKTFEDILSAKTTPEKEGFNTDAVSGATISSDAVKYAIIKALKSEPTSSNDNKVITPTVSALWGNVTDAMAAGLKISVSSSSNVTIRHTTDGSEPSETSEELTSMYGRINHTFYGKNPNGTKMPLKIAAFDNNGNKSDIVTTWLVFANPNEKVEYNSGTFEGSYDDIKVSAKIEFSYYGSNNLIKEITLDSSTKKKYSEFIDELLAEVYFKQSANIDDIELISGQDAEAQKNILKAIDDAIKKAVINNKPVLANSLPTENNILHTDLSYSENEVLSNVSTHSEDENITSLLETTTDNLDIL